MKQIKQFLIASLVITGTLFSSCIKEEDFNIEADILSATITNANELLIVQPTIDNNKITFRLIEEPEKKVYLFAPAFELSKGATINPESGTELDFTEDQTYVVTAEDGVTTKEYTVSFIVDKGVLLNYSFENVEVSDKDFHVFYELLGNGSKRYQWDNGNQGYSIMAKILLPEGEEVTPSVYPTAQIDAGYKGKGVKLQTNSTGELGATYGSPLAAGNLFLGEFKLSLLKPITSTRFGQPYTFTSAPKAVKAYYKYKAGENFEINNEPSFLEVDAWDAYAILFERTEENNFLTGEHSFEDERIVSIARLDDSQRVETDEWTEFEINFENVEGKSFDPDADYMFTIVFSSSQEGDKFNGAVGSTLYIDEVEIILAN